MSAHPPELDLLLAELAAAELAARAESRETVRIEASDGRASYAYWQASQRGMDAARRCHAAEDAITAYALRWAEERARAFVEPANETQSGWTCGSSKGAP